MRIFDQLLLDMVLRTQIFFSTTTDKLTSCRLGEECLDLSGMEEGCVNVIHKTESSLQRTIEWLPEGRWLGVMGEIDKGSQEYICLEH